MIPVGIVLLLLEVIIEFVVEIVEAGFLIGGGLGALASVFALAVAAGIF